MKHSKPILICFLLAITFGSFKCKHKADLNTNNSDPNQPSNNSTCDPDTIYFQNDVLPLLVSNCATSNCHDQQSAQDDVVLIDYLSVMETGEIKAGDPSDSELYEVIMESDPEDIMPPPPLSQLNDDQKLIIKNWIEQGAKNNSCIENCDTNNVTFSGTIWPMMQTNCTGCHTNVNAGGGIIIEDYEDVVASASNGSLMGVITHSTSFSPMPKNGTKFSDCKIRQIEKWIENGTPND
jgi:uncharacterized membrane protein